MKLTIFIFGGLSIAILILFQLSQLSLLGFYGNSNFFLIVSGILFIAIGFIISRSLSQGDELPVINKSIDPDQLKKTKLTRQEYKVFRLMAKGLSNTEIARGLFISENTVKTHVSKILIKLNAKRRTQAIRIGKDLNII